MLRGVPGVTEGRAPARTVPARTQTDWLRIWTRQAGHCRGPGQRKPLTTDAN